ncbi:MAG: hypothetical protein FJ398_01795 [Verrucomicrobia bacterium]|nr:hypothetical protein [Verrucomicrobiota bacterium]
MTTQLANRLNGGKLNVEARGTDLVLTFAGVRPPRVAGVHLAPGDLLRFTIQGTAGRALQVQVSESLDPPRWVLLREVQLSASGG